jgi:hypothetical protein
MPVNIQFERNRIEIWVVEPNVGLAAGILPLLCPPVLEGLRLDSDAALD